MASTLRAWLHPYPSHSVRRELIALYSHLSMRPPDRVIIGVVLGPKGVSLTRIGTIILGVKWHNIDVHLFGTLLSFSQIP